jgi:hypothetical protein
MRWERSMDDTSTEAGSEGRRDSEALSIISESVGA